jgi:hypothetical protein
MGSRPFELKFSYMNFWNDIWRHNISISTSGSTVSDAGITANK